MSAWVNPSVVAPWHRLCGSTQAKAWDVFKPQNWLDRVFEVGIIGKGLNGAA